MDWSFIREYVPMYVEAAGLTLRDAVKQAAKQTGARKNQLYQTMLARQEE